MRHLSTLILLTVVACTGTDGKDTDIDTDDTDTTGAGPTWTEVHDEILMPSCGLAGCHAAPSANGMELSDAATSYDEVVDAPSFGVPTDVLVAPGDSDASYLIHKLEGAATIAGDPMPPPFGGQDPTDVQAIRDWIDAGAANN